MLAFVAIIVGGLLGGASGDSFFGALVGAALGWLGVRSWRQQREIVALRAELKRPAPLTPPAEAAIAEPAPMEPGADVAIETLPSPALAEPMIAATEADTPAQAVPAVELPPALPPAPPKPGPLEPLREWLFGGNTIVKAGVGILFIGLAFLAKYASEHVQVPVEWRLAGIGLAAIALLVLGWRLRVTRPGYGQVLQGGAVAVLYLTLFVAFRFYGVLSIGPVFALMVVVAALAAALAVLQDARSLAFIGALGGFATPLLVSSGSGNVQALFSYYLVLDLGIAAVAWYRTWRPLNLLGFAFTFVVATAWGVLQYRESDYATGQGFLIAFFLLFIAILLMPGRQAQPAPTGDRWVNGTLMFGLPTVSFALQYGLVRHTEYGTALSALVLAAFYVVLAMWLRSRPRLAVVFEGSLAVGMVFLALVIPFAFDARSTAGAWALEGAGLVWLGFRQTRRLPRAFGYALLLLAGASLMGAIDRFPAPTEWPNALLFNGLMLAAGSLVAAHVVQRRATPAEKPEQVGERIVEPMLIAWATLWCVVTAATHVDALVAPLDRLAALLGAASLLALVYTVLANRFDWRHVAAPVLAFAPLLGLGLAISAMFLPRPLAHGGAWAWPLAAAVHLVTLRLAAPHWPRWGAHLAHAVGALCLAAFGAQQGLAITEDWGDAASAWPWLGWLVVPAVLLLALPRPGAALRWPVRLFPEAYQRSAAAVLTVALLLWTLLANASSDGAAQPLPYVPLLNPLDIGIGIVLVAALAWLKSEPARAGFAARPSLTPAALGIAGFVWLNAMLVRAFHHYGGVPFRVEAWADSLAVQTGLTLLWTATALVLMWFAAKRALRAPWMVGAALLAAVVLKLLLIDLSGTGTVTRIVSFIGVGVLMLVIGYVAPLPAAREKSHAAG